MLRLEHLLFNPYKGRILATVRALWQDKVSGRWKLHWFRLSIFKWLILYGYFLENGCLQRGQHKHWLCFVYISKVEVTYFLTVKSFSPTLSCVLFPTTVIFHYNAPCRAIVPQMSLHAPSWSERDAQSNFCEEDYAITPYIAEFVNTLSNLAYVICGCIGLWRERSNSNRTRCIGYYGLIIVGICSGLFHSLLRFWAQMADDLSMFLATAPILYRLLTASSSAQQSQNIALALSATLTLISAIHVVADEALLHCSTFGVMIIAIAFLTNSFLRKHGNITGKSGASKDAAKSLPRTTSQLRSSAQWGAISFGLGFALWVVDVTPQGCSMLRNLRAQVGLPWAFLLELHGW